MPRLILIRHAESEWNCDHCRSGWADVGLADLLNVHGKGRCAITLDPHDRRAGQQPYQRIALLAATLTREELLRLTTEQILHCLFWQERVRGMLPGLGREESDGLIRERGQVEVGCDFCGAQYRFDAVDVGEMFTPPQDQPPGGEGMH